MTYNELAFEIGTALSNLVAIHEREEHDGERCQDEAVNLIAYLSHRIGLHFDRDDPEAMEAFRLLVGRSRDYRAIHTEHEH
jgi:hypothetical protein